MTSPRAGASPRLLGVASAFDGSRMIRGDVLVGEGRILDIGVGQGVGDHVAAPGFVDLQVNGFGGVDLQSAPAGAVVDMARRLAATGVTAYQPTVISAPLDAMVRTLETLDDAAAAGGVARMLPAHLEGPFLSPRWRGAHLARNLRLPDREVLHRLLSSGRVGYMTLAPELPGASGLVKELCERGVVVAIGHSDATAEQAQEAFAAGVSVLTHAFNAHRRFSPRDPGPLPAALVNERVWITAIADGIHLAPLTLALLGRAAGDRLVAISDAIAASGLGDGSFCFGELDVSVREGRAELSDGCLAGSTATLDAGVRELVAAGIALEAALGAVTSRPAGVIGDATLGRLRKGGPGDVVVLDRELRPIVTLLGGLEIAACEQAAPPAIPGGGQARANGAHVG